MANPDRWLICWRTIATTFFVQAMICLPLAAETTPAAILDGRSSEKLLQRIAFPPTATETSPGTNKRALQTSLDEARTILEDLRFFADTAREIIEMGQKITVLRRENKNLKRNLVDHLDDRQDLESSLAKIETKPVPLIRTVLAQWLNSERLRRDETEKDSQLASARAAWIATAGRLNVLKHQLADHRNKARNLRAKTAALAAETGRTRRAIINLKQEAALLDADRKIVKATTKHLRLGISTRLRTILLTH